MPIIHISGQDALLEITEQCRTGCNTDYCYKKLTVSSTGSHVPLEVIESRLQWIKKYTDANAITLLGGEPWLHPQYVEICKLVLKMRFRLDIITSGVIGPREINNYKYSMELFEAGLLDISLSYHGERNHRQFASVVEELQTRIEKRRQNLIKIGRDPLPVLDLLCMWIVSRNTNYDQATFFKLANDCYKLVGLTALCHGDKEFQIAFENYKSQFSDGKNQLNFTYYHDLDRQGLRVKFTIRGQQEINPGIEVPTISSAEAGVCGAIQSTIKQDYITLDSMIIRTDGGVCFAEAQCVDTPHPLIIANSCQTEKQIYQAISDSLKQIHNHVFLYNRLKARDNCDENGKEQDCKACPFGRMCTPCWQTKRPWEQ